MHAITLHLGLDVHKDSITIAIAQAGLKREIRVFGTITNDLHALEKALTRIRKAHRGAPLEVAYEAGPCGFGIARRLQQLAVPCLVAAPSLIPVPVRANVALLKPGAGQGRHIQIERRLDEPAAVKLSKTKLKLGFFRDAH